MRRWNRVQSRLRDDEGQAIIMVALAMSFFLIASVGLGIDGSHLYSQRVAAQTAADAAAQSAMMSIFNGTNGAGAAAFTSTSGTNFNCTTTDAKSPCVYAARNGFGATASDTVNVAFSSTAPAGVTISPVATDPTSVVTVTVSRQVTTFLVRFAGPTAATVTAKAVAAIVLVTNPTPLLITEPTGADALTAGGSTLLTICGGPTQSVEINSSDAAAFEGGHVHLENAGPADTLGDCTSGTGADFGVFGGVSSPAQLPASQLGSTGHYRSPSPQILDPFRNVTPPSDPNPAAVANPATTSVPKNTDGCVQASNCTLYSPGHYVQLKPGNDTVLFKPGVYYVKTGGVDFKQTDGGGTNFNVMCTDTVACPSDPDTGRGMLIYDTGTTNAQGFAATGGFNVDTLVNMAFQGPTLTTVDSSGHTVPAGKYYNIVWWEDRNAVAQTHGLGQGNGCFQLTGTLYITNTKAIMDAAVAAGSTHVQEVDYQGTPCGNTVVQGDIVVARLHLGGNASIKMNLLPYGFVPQRQVALVQ